MHRCIRITHRAGKRDPKVLSVLAAFSHHVFFQEPHVSGSGDDSDFTKAPGARTRHLQMSVAAFDEKFDGPAAGTRTPVNLLFEVISCCHLNRLRV
jgi:hypothetical protein